MKGALVFLAVFAIMLVVTLGNPTIPFGRQIYYAIGGVNINYPIAGIPVSTLVPAVFNGVVYGVIVWIIYSIVASATGKNKNQTQNINQNVNLNPPDKEKDTTNTK
ncbi:hypothetical protein MUP37_04400 [Candidatus Bathyarchaeota archaeon]|nr:hypothetical protein [Candidatus Bathyarchaeota archaeon]